MLLPDLEILYLAIRNFRSDMRMQNAFFLKSGRPLHEAFSFGVLVRANEVLQLGFLYFISLAVT